MTCILSNPVDYSGATATADFPFAFSTIDCGTPTMTWGNGVAIQGITNANSGAGFAIVNTISYGQILIIFFLIIFLCVLLGKTLWNFVWKDEKAKI